MTLLAAEGIGRLAREHETERAAFDRALQMAIDLFESNPGGMPERDLVETLVTGGVSRSVASACADELLSGGLAQKNWQTGFLTHKR